MFTRSTFLSLLARVVGSEHVLAEAALRSSYEVDWTRRWKGEACAVVRPANSAEVTEILRASRDAGVSVVPQGGNTGLVGGSIPTNGALLMNLRRLRGVWDFDDVGGEISVGAGTTVTELQSALEPYGQEFAVDLGSRDVATIGGMLATNAGGSRVMRYGSMGSQLIGLNAVMPNGTEVVRMPGLRKDSTGYDLRSIFVGSEGTLGVITEARVRTVTRAGWVCTALVGTAEVSDAIEIMAKVQKSTDCVRSVEFISVDAMQLACDYLEQRAPVVESNAYLLIEWAANAPRFEEVERALGHVRPEATAVAEDPRRAMLWRFRDSVPEAVAAQGIPHKLDVSLPVGRVAAFLSDAEEICRAFGGDVTLITFGHLADGNLHLNLLGLSPDDNTLDLRLLQCVASYGGSISAEHGIGRAKVDYLHLVRTADEVNLMRRIKDAFDPDGILNPGVILPRTGEAARG